MPGFKNLRKKVHRRRVETLLLAGYAFAITCALFVSLLNNGGEREKQAKPENEIYDLNDDVMTPAFNDSASDNPFELLYTQVNNLKLLSDEEIVSSKYIVSHGENKQIVMPVKRKPQIEFQQIGSYEGIYQKEHRVLVVSPGDSFIGILTNLGMENKSATAAYNTLRKVFDARNLKVGQHIELTATFDVQTKELEALDTLVIEPVRGTKYILHVNENDEFEVKVEQEKFASEVRFVNGRINGNISASLNKAGLPLKLCSKVTQMFAHIIDFKRDVQKNDSFTIKYEVSKDAKGNVVRVGDVLYASFTLRRHTYKLYRYKNRVGEIGYYDEKGGAKKTGLDKKPLAKRNARISSLFGYRRHPIYKTTKFHSGVDYAAPRGTAIFASGAGVVEMARYVNGYGNFIKIRHNSEYETAYGHMQGFASGMRPGVRVKKGQIIGYVGSTGRSTGPHLHFEILRKGQRIDPLKAKVATGNDLTGSQLAEFKREVKKIDNMKPEKKMAENTLAGKNTSKTAEVSGKKSKTSDSAKAIKGAESGNGKIPAENSKKAAKEPEVNVKKDENTETGTDTAAKPSGNKVVYPPKLPNRRVKQLQTADNARKNMVFPSRKPAQAKKR